MLTNLQGYKIVLGSNSPRRKELLAGLDIPFEVKVIADIDESYPDSLPLADVPLYLARKKAEAYVEHLAEDELLITADTVVIAYDPDEYILGKPADRDEAIGMLRNLSGKKHDVVTGVCLMTLDKTYAFAVTSTVTFAHLEEREIIYYVDKYNPLDKAGSYGIQEWIGFIGVAALEGSFYNVMGLPVQRLYQELKKF